MSKSYAVVNFINDNSSIVDGESASEVPSCWIVEDGQKCWWPTSKNAGFHISRKTVPNESNNNWQLHDIKVIGFYDDLASARQKADGFSSGEESHRADLEIFSRNKKPSLETIEEEKDVQNKKRKRKNTLANKKKQASDDSDGEETINLISTPPKLMPDKNDGTKTPADPRPNKLQVTSNVPASIDFKIKHTPSRITHSEELPSPSRVRDTPTDCNGNPTSSMPFIDTSLNDFFIDSKTLSLQIEGLATTIKELSDKVAEKMGELAFSMRQISSRLDNIEKAINSHQVTTSNDYKDLAELFPLTTIEQVTEFENHLTVGDVKTRLVSYLQKVGGNNAKDCISRTLKKIFGPEVAKKSSWYGLRGNFKVGDLAIMNSVKEVVQQSFGCTDKVFEDEGKEWFRQGGQKFARIQKKIPPPPENPLLAP